jgi:hypothetical protein
MPKEIKSGLTPGTSTHLAAKNISGLANVLLTHRDFCTYIDMNASASDKTIYRRTSFLMNNAQGIHLLYELPGLAATSEA